MPSVPLHLPSHDRGSENSSLNPLPTLLQTPSGLAILELQGSINIPNPEPATSSPVIPVGRLVFPHYSTEDPSSNTEWMKTVHLYVGRHQRLTGEVRKLVNPLAVIRRRSLEGEEKREPGGGMEELEIVEVIHHKIVFSSRPEPVGDWSV